MSDKTHIYIISTQFFQSQLLAHFLHSQTGLSCAIEPPSDLSTHIRESGDETAVILWDCTGKNTDDPWNGLGFRVHSRSKNHFVALFNVRKNDRIEMEAIRRGIRGVFFENVEMDLLAKGVEAISNGELWYSRECMVAFLTGEHRPESIPPTDEMPLTQRENNIIRKIASGLSSSQIADELYISPNTVKTHIRNIYKKINVSNRFEAVRWVNRNI